METKKCDCKLCIESRIIDAAIVLRSPDLLTRVIRRLQNNLCNEGQELDVLKAVMDGSWPSAQRQLYRALGKTIQT